MVLVTNFHEFTVPVVSGGLNVVNGLKETNQNCWFLEKLTFGWFRRFPVHICLARYYSKITTYKISSATQGHIEKHIQLTFNM